MEFLYDLRSKIQKLAEYNKNINVGIAFVVMVLTFTTCEQLRENRLINSYKTL